MELKKKIAALAVATGIVGVSGVAFAYWTATGTGSGTGSVGTDDGVTITNVDFSGPLYPGHDVTVTFDIVNDSANTAVNVDEVVADTAAGTNGITGLPTGCAAADFSFAAVELNNAQIAEGATLSGVTGTLSMANTSANQDACKSAAPVLHLVVDNSDID